MVRDSSKARSSKRRVIAGWAFSIVVALGLGVLFGWWTFRPPTVDDVADEPATVTVSETTVGRSIPVAVSASWLVTDLGTGAAEGTLTSFDVSDGHELTAGTTVYTVDLRPVVVAQGQVPAFRDLTQGARGADVQQLQELLIAQGFLPEGAADGYFGPSTTRGVREWQRSLGVERDGVVHAGDILFTSSLPARVLRSADVSVGKPVSRGDVLLQVVQGAPEVVLHITGDSVDQNLPIEVTIGDQVVSAKLNEMRRNEHGNISYTLTRDDGSPVCPQPCSDVPLSKSPFVLQARQILTPDVSGPGIPVAALWLRADGSTYVMTEDGTEIDVRVLAQGQGRAVLSGVDVGVTLRLADQLDSQ